MFCFLFRLESCSDCCANEALGGQCGVFMQHYNNGAVVTPDKEVRDLVDMNRGCDLLDLNMKGKKEKRAHGGTKSLERLWCSHDL